MYAAYFWVLVPLWMMAALVNKLRNRTYRAIMCVVFSCICLLVGISSMYM